jgi:uncharacterized protein
LKIILDSNVVVAAFASHGLCQALFEYCPENHQIIVSQEILVEVERLLIKKIKLPIELVETQISFIRAHSEVCIPLVLDSPVCRDPNDDHLLGLALGHNIPYLVTGDKDLLVIKNFHNTAIVAPREFWFKMTEA